MFQHTIGEVAAVKSVIPCGGIVPAPLVVYSEIGLCVIYDIAPAAGISLIAVIRLVICVGIIAVCILRRKIIK